MLIITCLDDQEYHMLNCLAALLVRCCFSKFSISRHCSSSQFSLAILHARLLHHECPNKALRKNIICIKPMVPTATFHPASALIIPVGCLAGLPLIFPPPLYPVRLTVFEKVRNSTNKLEINLSNFIPGSSADYVEAATIGSF